MVFLCKYYSLGIILLFPQKLKKFILTPENTDLLTKLLLLFLFCFYLSINTHIS
jgi:hypothetical protein